MSDKTRTVYFKHPIWLFVVDAAWEGGYRQCYGVETSDPSTTGGALDDPGARWLTVHPTAAIVAGVPGGVELQRAEPLTVAIDNIAAYE